MGALSRDDWRRGALRVLIAPITAVLMLAGLTAAGHTDPKPTAGKLRKELAALRKQSDLMIAEYSRERVELQKAEKAEKSAVDDLRRAERDFGRATEEIRALAVERYRAGAQGTVSVLMSGVDPSTVLNRMALTEQFMSEQDARLREFTTVRDAHRQARVSAGERTAELRASLERLDAQKRRTERLIAKIKDRIDLLYPTPGLRRADGTWVPQLPSGPDNITPRTRLVRQLITQRFAMRFGVGCYRANGGIAGGGEHPLGRACDFMLSQGGGMPSAAATGQGNEIAAWAIKNAQRLGIMYIIFRQRIWHSRGGSWRMMSDRGGITANHYDHVHISMY